jgi:hypothetical protein
VQNSVLDSRRISAKSAPLDNDLRLLFYFTEDPPCSRRGKTPGEGSFRIQNYVKGFFLGLEGDKSQPTKKIVATCKHYTAYDLENWEGVRTWMSITFYLSTNMHEILALVVSCVLVM